jgi:hypothetical protein
LIIRPRRGAVAYPFPKPHKEIPVIIGTWIFTITWQLTLNVISKIAHPVHIGRHCCSMVLFKNCTPTRRWRFHNGGEVAWWCEVREFRGRAQSFPTGRKFGGRRRRRGRLHRRRRSCRRALGSLAFPRFDV